MKITIADTTIHSTLIGGAQTFLPSLLKGIKEKGHEVHLVTNGIPDKRVEKQIADSGVVVQADLWKKTMLAEDAAKIFGNWMNSLRPDIYVVSVSWDTGWLVLPYLDPAITTFAIAHSNNDAFYLPAKYYNGFLNGVIGVSDEICQKFDSVSRIDLGKIHRIPYGIKALDKEPGRNDRPALHLVFVGRLEEPDKRISDVVAIIKKLRRVNIAYQFSIIGDGSRFEHIKKELAEEISAGKVQLTGWMKSEEVLQVLQQSDIFILTSSSEGFSISLIEAMANGCCPVVTNISSGSVQLIEDGLNGFLLPVGDIDGFVKKLKYLAQHREQLDEMRKAAWETGWPYSIDKMVDTYLGVFKKGIINSAANKRKPDPEFPVMESCRSKYPKWLRRLKKLVTVMGSSGMI